MIKKSTGKREKETSLENRAQILFQACVNFLPRLYIEFGSRFFRGETFEILVSLRSVLLSKFYTLPARKITSNKDRSILTIVSRYQASPSASGSNVPALLPVFIFFSQGCKQQQSHVFCFNSDLESKTPSESD